LIDDEMFLDGGKHVSFDSHLGENYNIIQMIQIASTNTSPYCWGGFTIYY